MTSSITGRFGKYAPPTKEEQIEIANAMGPADPSALEGLAQYADYQADIGEWHFGHTTAQRLRLLGQMLENQQDIGSEERGRLQRTIADLAQQVDEMNGQNEHQGVELVFRFVSDGPGAINIGELHVMVDLLVDAAEQGGVTGS